MIIVLKKPVLNELSEYMLIYFAALVAAAYIAYLLGTDYFVLPKVTKPEGMAYTWLFSWVMFTANFAIWLGHSVALPMKKAVKAAVLYAPVWLICAILPLGIIAKTLVMPSAYILIIGIRKRIPHKKLAARHIVFTLIILAYNLIVMPVKSGILPMHLYSPLTVASKLFYQIDLTRILILYYLKGSALNVPKFFEPVVCGGPALEHHHISEEKDGAKNGAGAAGENENCEEIGKLSQKRKWAVWAAFCLIQIAQLTVVVAVCALGNVVLELVVVFGAFLISRKVLGDSWHSEKLTTCTAVATIVFYAACKVTVPAQLSMFFPCLVGALIAYGMNYVARQDLFKRNI